MHCALRQVPNYECISYSFHNVTDDMAVMRDATVLVAYHGAGESNAMWMRSPLILETHAKHFGTKHLWWSAFWWPMISMQTDYFVKCWGLNFEARRGGQLPL